MNNRGTKPLNILHTIETGGPGGAETLLVEIASHLNPAKFRSLALVPGNSWVQRQLSARGIQSFPLESRRWYNPRPLMQMLGVIRSERVDLIHSHLPAQNFYGSVAGRLSGKKSVTTYHGPVELQQSVGIRGRIQLQTARKASSFSTVVSDQMGNELRKAGFRSNRIIRVYNGVNVDLYRHAARGPLRQLIGANEVDPIVGIVANIREPKGYEHFVRAAKLVVDRVPNAHFVSIGDKHPVLFSELERLVSDLGLQNRITFLGFRADVPQLLPDFTVFVLSSLSEGFPFAAIEAMAAAKPSVMTRCGGPEEVAEDGVTGFLVPVADPQRMADRIVELISSPGRAQGMGNAARAKVLRDFTVEGMMQAYETLYQQLCSPSA